MGAFVAIDFETADAGWDSACAVALVRVEAGVVVRREQRLVRPPRSRFAYTHVHGIRWQDVERCGPFGEVWPDLEPVLAGADFLAAHNASFDRRVLEACCGVAGLAPPRLPWRCTVQTARAAWRLFPTRLPDVCRFLGIPLVHHDALSDAEACARIVVAAQALVGGGASPRAEVGLVHYGTREACDRLPTTPSSPSSRRPTTSGATSAGC
ncbi:MAG: 3'-5' exonuclease [Planctomycetes bacterium]|nr:3'-5' exonuclease [Planctomycetota bacterium]